MYSQGQNFKAKARTLKAKAKDTMFVLEDPRD